MMMRFNSIWTGTTASLSPGGRTPPPDPSGGGKTDMGEFYSPCNTKRIIETAGKSGQESLGGRMCRMRHGKRAAPPLSARNGRGAVASDGIADYSEVMSFFGN